MENNLIIQLNLTENMYFKLYLITGKSKLYKQIYCHFYLLIPCVAAGLNNT